MLWDFGSAARHHELYCPWLEGRSPAGISTMRGAMSPESGRAEDVAKKIRRSLEARGLLGEPVGVDVVEPPVLFALQREGIEVVDGQQLMQRARVIKSRDEIVLLDTACMMVDAAYDELYREMRPGMRENECVGLVSKVLYDLGSEHVEGVNAISGERCSPHPHVYSDRVLRPGDPAYFDILHSYLGYRTCYYRTFAVGSASPALVDAYKHCRYILDAAIALIRPGVTTDQIVSVWPKAEEFGFPTRRRPSRCNSATGSGCRSGRSRSSAGSCRSTIPRRSKRAWCSPSRRSGRPPTAGRRLASKSSLVTSDGCEVITRFPAEDLMIAGRRHYYTAHGQLPGVREIESQRNAGPAHE